MELTHKLTYNSTTTVISEPIGFDDLKMTLKRHDLHGIGAEVSLGNLEFYGTAFNIIKTAYDADIDSEVVYAVFADQTEIYSGKIDLSTYSVKQGDYQSVSVKVGEVGVKTTFNNRLDTEVDLNTPKTIDGDTVEAPDWLNLHIPPKHLLYTNLIRQRGDNSNVKFATDTAISYADGIAISAGISIFIPIEGTAVNEFGNFTSALPYTTYFPTQATTVDVPDPSAQFEPKFIQYYPSEEHESKFGTNTKAKIDARIILRLTKMDSTPQDTNKRIRFALFVESESESLRSYSPYVDGEDVLVQGSVWNVDIKFSGEISAEHPLTYYLFVEASSSFHYEGLVDICQGSYLKMTMYDNLTEDEPVNADMLLVHDALNIVSHAISENALAVKSDWYKTPVSKWNAGSIGGGALKALTNGYHIRGLFTDDETERNMPMSFKSLIESLNAQDCIGWGFTTENGVLCVRVERWSWFYKDTVILTLTNVAEVQIDIDPDRIITDLKIGYKKYATNDQYNSIDSPHGTRTFVNGIKAVSKTETQECDIIADNYAIEEIRRAAYQENETKETTYDESIFLFELTEKQGVYSIGHTAYNAEGIGNAKEFINAKLTPRHMASRWKDYIFAANNATPFKFTAGELNYKASFLVLPEYLNAIHSLKPFLGSATAASEDDDIAYEHAIFSAEKITFSCPLTIAQYQMVKANPYGLISVNGMQGWILGFIYSFEDGMADFTLIKKTNSYA